MPDKPHPFVQLLRSDPRYSVEAYQLVQNALTYAHEVLKYGDSEDIDPDADEPAERHISGQQLCEAIRQYASEQFGLMAKVVLNSWGLHQTRDFGEIVFNLIEIEHMRKSDADTRQDFHEVFDFDEAFQQQFQISRPD